MEGYYGASIVLLVKAWSWERGHGYGLSLVTSVEEGRNRRHYIYGGRGASSHCVVDFVLGVL